jgi:hypothetical protein
VADSVVRVCSAHSLFFKTLSMIYNAWLLRSGIVMGCWLVASAVTDVQSILV